MPGPSVSFSSQPEVPCRPRKPATAMFHAVSKWPLLSSSNDSCNVSTAAVATNVAPPIVVLTRPWTASGIVASSKKPTFLTTLVRMYSAEFSSELTPFCSGSTI